MKTYNDWKKIWTRGHSLFYAIGDDIDEMTQEEREIKEVRAYRDAYYEFMAASNRLHGWFTRLPF